jgi:hypothetical protein
MLYENSYLKVWMSNSLEAAARPAPPSPASSEGGFMRSVSILIALILMTVSCAVCWGQAADECKPSVLNIPEAKYPCIYPDNRALSRNMSQIYDNDCVRVLICRRASVSERICEWLGPLHIVTSGKYPVK